MKQISGVYNSTSPALRFEAEDMQYAGFRLEKNKAASGGKMLSLVGGSANETGEATITFLLPAGSTLTGGVYSIYVGYFDDNDGVASYNAHALDKSGYKGTEWLGNKNLRSNAANQQTKTVKKVFDSFYLENGSSIGLSADENRGDYGRIDYVDLALKQPASTSSFSLNSSSGGVLGGPIGSENDIILGSPNNDVLAGRDIDDIILGDKGDDLIRGKGGNDTLFGNEGNDSIWGGRGDDILRGGLGKDTLKGGTGNDTFVLAHGEGSIDRILDFSGGDKIGLADGLSFGQLTLTQSRGDILISAGTETLATVVGVSGLNQSAFVNV